jgi:shikimate dehydrogenase
MPHKGAVLGLLDRVEPGARLVGAVNTVVVEDDGSLFGLNTDGGGFVEACSEAGIRFEGRRVLLLGAGGAAAAIGAAVLGEGSSQLDLLNRSRERAENLRRSLLGAAPEGGGASGEVRVLGWDERDRVARETDVIVNATYLGMKDGDPLPVSAEALSGAEAVCDAVYRAGGATELVRCAREAGVTAVGGERMLLYQGVQAQRAWGLEPDVKAMSDALV